MDLSRIVKWLVILILLFVAWKFVIPWAKEEMGSRGRSAQTSGGSGTSPCVAAGERASEAWGGGLSRFINPPYDMDAWSSFRSDVDSKITQSGAQCTCAEESCRKVQNAMQELRGLVSDMDGAIRSGGSPGQDIVQRQEAIDRQLEEARELVRTGK